MISDHDETSPSIAAVSAHECSRTQVTLNIAARHNQLEKKHKLIRQITNSWTLPFLLATPLTVFEDPFIFV